MVGVGTVQYSALSAVLRVFLSDPCPLHKLEDTL